MLEVFINFICAFMLAISGFYFIKRIRLTDEKLDLKKIMILLINSIAISIIRSSDSTFFTSIFTFILNIITYKIAFKQTIEESTIETGILTMLIIGTDMITAILLVKFFQFTEYTNNFYIYILINLMIAITPNFLVMIKKIKIKINSLLKTLLKKDLKINGFFIFLTMLSTSGIGYNIIKNYEFNFQFIGDIIVVEAIVIIGIIYMNNKDTYNKLSKEYDILLSNVQTFEDWIEKEQFTRHEYKNQLAVLYALSSERNVKEKIQEIINQNLNINDEVVNNLKDLPKGGLKGLLYYKTIIAEKAKLKITVDTSIKNNGILQKLNKEKNSTLAKLIGIYYDNAIDAAKESRKKILLLEIYELKESVNFVISNTFKKSSLMDNRFEKGVSSKGKGHGYGLYFAKNLLKKNTWIEERQEIIDNYYIETITIKKGTSKK